MKNLIIDIPFHVRVRAKQRKIKVSNFTNLISFYIEKVVDSEYYDKIEKSFSIRDFNKRITIFCKFNRNRKYLRISSIGEIDEIYPQEGEFTIMFYENGTMSSRIWVHEKKQKRLKNK
jgi:hypothetical protein